MIGKRFFVTGGAGFIGSHLVDRLVKSGQVTVYDNLSVGKIEFVKPFLDSGKARLIRADLLDCDTLTKSMQGHDAVFHLAADSDVQRDSLRPATHLDQEIMATYNTLEAMRQTGVVDIVFTSSSVIYGEATLFPIPEDYGPLLPISLYGAGKLSGEGLISSYCHLFGFRAWILRNANIVGSHGTHGVIYDFIHKLRQNPRELVIRGDGAQQKSYLHVADFIDAILFTYQHASEVVNVFNIGCKSTTSVIRIAEIVVEEMGLKNVAFRYTGGKRGWPGDVPHFELAVSRLNNLGWTATLTSDEAVRKAVRELESEITQRSLHLVCH
jgi:UDP-glucose 4-epimerase